MWSVSASGVISPSLTDRQTETERDTEREREREGDRQTDIDRHKKREININFLYLTHSISPSVFKTSEQTN